MDIVHLTPEFAPLAKVGGLADVVYGLARALVKKGHTVHVLLPKYDLIDDSQIEELRMHSSFSIEESGQSISNTLYTGKFQGVSLLLIEAHHPHSYFKRGKIYGERDDNDRFLYFCKAAAHVIKGGTFAIDALHLHDWPTAGTLLFLKDQEHPRTVFTIHNIQHQGRCSPFNLERLDAPFSYKELADPLYVNTLNLLKGAILYADAITTVSPTYKEEIQTAEYGLGLEKELIEQKKKLYGILNGIDTDYWNPATDPALFARYSVDNPLLGKQKNKREIQKQLHLTDGEKPLVVAITRLVAQKGPELIEYGIGKTLELGGQFILLGGAPDIKAHAHFSQLYPKNPDVAIFLEQNETLAHQLYAASDLFLMPSHFEPCGLSQMISLRYGSIPLVRSTGGLKDTVIDNVNGFTFDAIAKRGVDSVLTRAFTLYKQEPKRWHDIMIRGMKADYSWDRSADKYLEIYL